MGQFYGYNGYRNYSISRWSENVYGHCEQLLRSKALGGKNEISRIPNHTIFKYVKAYYKLRNF